MSQGLLTRRKQMFRALRWSAVLFIGFLLVTHQVIARGPLSDIDATIAEAKRPNFAPWIDFVIRRIDDLGLRGFTAVVLLVSAVIISRRFKSWRPLNLAMLSLLFLNLFVGVSKISIGRTKPSLNVDLIFAGGMSYPSGHATNALVTWGILAYLIYRYSHVEVYHGRLLTSIVAVISFAVCAVSLFRDTHWLTDLFGGLFLGGALLVAIIAIDRYFPSVSQRS